jgi:hypothetical protein
MQRLVCACVLGGLALAGCYTVDFDENKSDIYYCQADGDCLKTHACVEFRCVENIGPKAMIQVPEALTDYESPLTSLIVDYEIKDFIISESNENIEGQGKVLVNVDDIYTVLADTQGVELDLGSGLGPGAHRLWIQAFYGDGQTPYTNPGATALSVFRVEDPDGRPLVSIVSPDPKRAHVVGEALEVEIAVSGFDIVDSGSTCRAPEGCDPFDPDGPTCDPEDCEMSTEGHAHIYLIPDFPGCLSNLPVGCGGSYVLTLRPGEATVSGERIRAVIPSNRFTEPGTYTFTASLQYNNHTAYPNNAFVIYDQIPLEVVER